MKKKYVVTTVAMLAAVSMLAACGNKESNTNTETTPTVTVAPTEAPSSEERGDGPTEVAPEVTVDHNQMVQDVVQHLKENLGDLYFPNLERQNDKDFMQNVVGLDESWYDVAYVETPSMSFGEDSFFMIHPTEGNLENVQNALEAYKQYRIAHTYESTKSVCHAALVTTIGDYVCYMVFTGSVGDLWMEEVETQVQKYTEANEQVKQMIAPVISGEVKVKSWTTLDKLYRKIVASYYGGYYSNVKVHEDEAQLAAYLADVLKLDAAWVEESIIEIHEDSKNTDTLILVNPTEGNAEQVVTALTEYKNRLVEAFAEDPVNAVRTQGAVVAQVDDYVCFAIIGDVIENPEEWGFESEEAMIAWYTNYNMNAVHAMNEYFGIVEEEVPFAE